MASRNSEQEPGSNLKKDPDEWTTSGEPMTDAQASYLKILSEETGELFDPDMTKGEAAKKIEELRERNPRLKKGRKPSR